MILALLRWTAFLWGCFAVAVMVYYAVQWFPDAGNLSQNEMAMGFAIGAFYGWPAWLSLPVFVLAQWHDLKPVHRMLLVLPVVMALLLWVVGWGLSH